jgi:protein O-mannosyl-transferase
MKSLKTKPGRALLPKLLLVAATLLVYGQALHFDFAGYDDDSYVTYNPYVRRGLTPDGLHWAFTTGHSANWHPLTWLSHMADGEIYGLNPGGHHATSVLLHVLNSLILLVLLTRMTQSTWRPLFVAGLFALHPLHVESVAWVSERKDVLSTFWGLLAILAYVGYAARKGLFRYLLVFLLLALSLMSKPMLVTLPFLFLLFDYWPLKRITLPDSGQNFLPSSGASIGRLLVEKVPLLLLSGACSVVTFLVQRSGGAVLGTINLPVHYRVANALISYVWYIWKMIWPRHLAVHYPHPLLTGHMWSLWQVAGAAIFLSLVSVVAIRTIRRYPYVAVGWFWYLGLLVPVIGLVQVGTQGMADRYTYLPLVGLFCVLVWGSADLLDRSKKARTRTPAVAFVIATVILCACGVASRIQLHHWKDSLALSTHALEVRPNDPVMHLNLGVTLEQQSRFEEARAEYSRTISLDPSYTKAYVDLGNLLVRMGRTEEALLRYSEALQVAPDSPEAHFGAAIACQTLGRAEESITHYRETIRLKPDHQAAQVNLGVLLARGGKDEEATSHFATAIELSHGDAPGLSRVGQALLMVGRADAAVPPLEEALRLDPERIETIRSLAFAYTMDPDLAAKNPERGIELAERARTLSGNRDPDILRTLAAAYASKGRLAEAIATAKEGIRLADESGTTKLADQLRQHLAIYEKANSGR